MSGHDLTGRTVLVTGASKGIGAACASALGAAGAHVVAHHGTDTAGAERAVADMPAERCFVLGADLSEPGAARELWREAVAWRGSVDVLVNNAAVLLEAGVDADDDAWDDVWTRSLAVNATGAGALLREATRAYRAAPAGGVVITLSSWSAQRGSGNPALVAYAASKAAIKAVTQTIARAYAAEGVLAYVIAPGVVATDMSVRSARSTGGEDAVTATLAMGEWVPPAELAELVTFLASGRARHLSGATLDVNGASYVR